MREVERVGDVQVPPGRAGEPADVGDDDTLDGQQLV
jgi:hypothetical protein